MSRVPAQLMTALAARLPGYLVPRLVREHAGAPAKTAVAGAASPDTGAAWDTLHSYRAVSSVRISYLGGSTVAFERHDGGSTDRTQCHARPGRGAQQPAAPCRHGRALHLDPGAAGHCRCARAAQSGAADLLSARRAAHCADIAGMRDQMASMVPLIVVREQRR